VAFGNKQSGFTTIGLSMSIHASTVQKFRQVCKDDLENCTVIPQTVCYLLGFQIVQGYIMAISRSSPHAISHFSASSKRKHYYESYRGNVQLLRKEIDRKGKLRDKLPYREGGAVSWLKYILSSTSPPEL
jgi:hypothetical protein